MSPVQLIRQLPLRRPLLLRGHTRWAEDTKVPGRVPRRWQRILLQENLPERWVGVNHYYDVPHIGCFYKSEILYQLVEMRVGEYNARKWWKYHLIHNMIHQLVAATIILATVWYIFSVARPFLKIIFVSLYFLHFSILMNIFPFQVGKSFHN